MAGFALLFFSMATTILVFTTTILVNIKLEKSKWNSTYSAAFFPVSIFAMMQFNLYVPRFFLNLIKRSKRIKLWNEMKIDLDVNPQVGGTS